MQTFFGKALGVSSFDLSATSFAAVGPAGGMTGDVLPIAIAKSFTDANPIINGQSGEFGLTPDTEVASKWTTLKEGNGARVTKDLCDPSYVLKVPISTGMSIDNSTGDKTSIYSEIDKHSGTDVYFPVVDNFSSNTIVGFICFRIIKATGGSTKLVTGFFKGPIATKFANRIGGANYGTYTPPALVQ